MLMKTSCVQNAFRSSAAQRMELDHTFASRPWSKTDVVPPVFGQILTIHINFQNYELSRWSNSCLLVPVMCWQCSTTDDKTKIPSCSKFKAITSTLPPHIHGHNFGQAIQRHDMMQDYLMLFQFQVWSVSQNERPIYLCFCKQIS